MIHCSTKYYAMNLSIIVVWKLIKRIYYLDKFCFPTDYTETK